MARVRCLDKEDRPADHQHVYADIVARRGGVQRTFKALLKTRSARRR